MPRIDASSVAEHRELHFERLLDAALGFVAENDVASLTLAELAKLTGRSRSSLYAYFGSADEMRVALCSRVLASWVDALIDELRTISSPDERLARFVGSQIADLRDPAVEQVSVFVMSLPNEPFRARMTSVLEPLTTELLTIVEQLGVEPPTRAATVVQGAIAAAYDQVRAGGDPDEAAVDTIAFVRAGLSALRHSPSTATPTHRDADRVVLLRGETEGEKHRGAAPGALAMVAAPSISVVLASATSTTSAADSSRDIPPTSVQAAPVRVARIAVAQLGWAGVAFATGTTGVGGTALHVALGLSLVVILTWSVRALGPVRLAPPGLHAMATLAAITSAAALVARYQLVEAALVTHIVLALLLLTGLTSITRAAWRNRPGVVGQPHLI